MVERTVVIVGATGSIGRQTVEVLKKLKGYRLVGFTYHSNISLANIIKKDFPEAEMVSTKEGYEGVFQLVEKLKPDTVVLAVPGFSGFEICLGVIPHTKRIALANKESLVCGGKFIKTLTKEHDVEIVPIDSEHSAIFQIIEDDPVKVVLTASGGALRDWPVEKLKHATIDDVLKHPVWSMGVKVTVDSATMVNKALEVLEAMELFSLSREQIEVLLHREGKVHGMVYLKDGTVKIHASLPDMRIPIAYSLTYPERTFEYRNYPEIFELKFEKPDRSRYPLFYLVDDIYSSYSLRTVYNSADEVAVQAFSEGRIGFTDIFKVVEKTLEKMNVEEVNSHEELKMIHERAKIVAKDVVECLSK